MGKVWLLPAPSDVGINLGHNRGLHKSSVLAQPAKCGHVSLCVCTLGEICAKYGCYQCIEGLNTVKVLEH